MWHRYELGHKQVYSKQEEEEEDDDDDDDDGNDDAGYLVVSKQIEDDARHLREGEHQTGNIYNGTLGIILHLNTNNKCTHNVM